MRDRARASTRAAGFSSGAVIRPAPVRAKGARGRAARSAATARVSGKRAAVGSRRAAASRTRARRCVDRRARCNRGVGSSRAPGASQNPCVRFVGQSRRPWQARCLIACHAIRATSLRGRRGIQRGLRGALSGVRGERHAAARGSGHAAHRRIRRVRTRRRAGRGRPQLHAHAHRRPRRRAGARAELPRRAPRGRPTARCSRHIEIEVERLTTVTRPSRIRPRAPCTNSVQIGRFPWSFDFAVPSSSPPSPQSSA